MEMDYTYTYHEHCPVVCNSTDSRVSGDLSFGKYHHGCAAAGSFCSCVQLQA